MKRLVMFININKFLIPFIRLRTQNFPERLKRRSKNSILMKIAKTGAQTLRRPLEKTVKMKGGTPG